MRPLTAAVLLVALFSGAFLWWPVAIVLTLLALVAALVHTNHRMRRHVAAVVAERDYFRTQHAAAASALRESYAPLAEVLPFPTRGGEAS